MRWLLVLAIGCGSQTPCDCEEPEATNAPGQESPLDERTVEQVLAAEHRLSWSDGTSVYTLHEDHRFELGPVGMSGRTIAGCWRTDDNHIVVIGSWSWINGVSRQDDYRRMRFSVGPPFSPAPSIHEQRVYQSYFNLEELVTITAEEHTAGCPDS